MSLQRFVTYKEYFCYLFFFQKFENFVGNGPERLEIMKGMSSKIRKLFFEAGTLMCQLLS